MVKVIKVALLGKAHKESSCQLDERDKWAQYLKNGENLGPIHGL